MRFRMVSITDVPDSVSGGGGALDVCCGVRVNDRRVPLFKLADML